MLKRLCAIRLRLLLDALTGSGRHRKGMRVLYGFLLLYCVVVFGGLFGLLFWALRPLAEAGLSWLYFALAGTWDLPYGEEVVGTITAVDTFLGVVLGISTAQYNKQQAKSSK